MRAAVMMKRIAEVSPRFKARMAGVLFLFLVLTSTFTEFFARGRLSFAAHIAAGVIEVSCMIAVTLLFYDISKPVNRGLFARGVRQSRGTHLGGPSMATGWRRRRHGISRTLLLPDRIPHFQVDLPASNSGCGDDDCGFELADLSINAARKLSVPL